MVHKWKDSHILLLRHNNEITQTKPAYNIIIEPILMSYDYNQLFVLFACTWVLVSFFLAAGWICANRCKIGCSWQDSGKKQHCQGYINE